MSSVEAIEATTPGKKDTHNSRQSNDYTANFLRDFPYVLQGIETSMITFSGFEVRLPKEFPVPLASRAQRLCEPAVLFRSVKTLLSSQRQSMVVQALSKCIQSQLEDYLLLIAEIETRVRSRDITLGLTACDALLSDSILALRLIHSVVREVSDQDLRSGQILSLLQEYTKHGDPSVRALGTELFDAANEPFQNMLTTWTRHGKLDDPFEEFFVAARDDNSLPSERFLFVESNVPRSISVPEARHAFETGNTLYLLRSLFYEEDYVRALGTQPNNNSGPEAMKHLNSILVTKYRLQTHLQALRDYLLLFKGDFAERLIAEAYQSLRIPAEHCSRHQLNDVMSRALEASSAQYDDPSVLGSLDYDILDKGEDQQAWEAFTMRYRFQKPLDAIIDPDAYQSYFTLFNTLWSFRWSAHVLDMAWQALRGLTVAYNLHHAKKQPVFALCEDVRHSLSRLIYELLTNAYTVVIETEWNRLLSRLPPHHDEPVTINEIRTAHREYIERVFVDASLGATVTMNLLIHQLLMLCVRFHEAIQTCFAELSDDESVLETLETQVLSCDEQFSTICGRIADELYSQESMSSRALAAKVSSFKKSPKRT